MRDCDLLARAWAGEVFSDLEIIDAHCHLSNLFQFSISKCDIEEMVKDADRLGVNQLCIAPHAALCCDYDYGNTLVREAAKRYPDRVLGYVTLNPNFPEEFDAQLSAYAEIPQFIGVKLHPTMHRFPINGAPSMEVFARLRDRGGFALVHTWYTCPYCSPSMCEEVLREYPEVPFIFAHAAGTYEGAREVAALVNRYENAYVDTSGFEFSKTSLEELLSMTDADKVVYGSDAPYHDMRSVFSRVVFAEIPEEQKRNIFAENFKRLITRNPKRDWRGE